MLQYAYWQLKMHDKIINTSEDVICLSGSNKKNIENRRNQAIGSVSQIMSMIDQISLGHYYFEVGLVLRDSMLVSKLVSSSEVWYGVNKDQYRKL